MITEAMVEAARTLLREHGWTINTRDAHEQLRVALEAAERAAWAPIETAPKDGTRIMIFIPLLDPPTIQAQWRACHEGGWDYGEWVDVWNNDIIEFNDGIAKPTHWRPIPEPPGPAAEGAR